MARIESIVPPGFRFHPTEEELVGFYLKRKVNSQKFDLDVIFDIDLYRMEPWEIQEKCSRMGNEEENEWYFFSYKDRKYPTGTRTNRATSAGFWKATGRDKAVLSNDNIIGMRKTLVFYKGRAPNGHKTDWIMHEYRLQTSDHAPPQEEGWVVCRAFRKPNSNHNQGFGAWNHQYNNNSNYTRNNANCNNIYNDTNITMGSSSVVQDRTNPTNLVDSSQSLHAQQVVQPFAKNYEQEITSNDNVTMMELPDLDSSSISTSLATDNMFDNQHISCGDVMRNEGYDNGSNITRWENYDNFLGSQDLEATSWFSDSIPNLELVTSDYELENTHNQMSRLLGCFPNL